MLLFAMFEQQLKELLEQFLLSGEGRHQQTILLAHENVGYFQQKPDKRILQYLFLKKMRPVLYFTSQQFYVIIYQLCLLGFKSRTWILP